MLISLLAAYIGLFITVHTTVKKLIWFSDRGLVFDYLHAYCIDIYNLIYHNLLTDKFILIPKPNPFGIAKPSKNDSFLWYDSLIKIPDYYAGTVASWNLKSNEVDKTKHDKIISNVFNDNINFNLVTIDFRDKIFSTGKIKITKYKE